MRLRLRVDLRARGTLVECPPSSRRWATPRFRWRRPRTRPRRRGSRAPAVAAHHQEQRALDIPGSSRRFDALEQSGFMCARTGARSPRIGCPLRASPVQRPAPRSRPPDPSSSEDFERKYAANLVGGVARLGAARRRDSRRAASSKASANSDPFASPGSDDRSRNLDGSRTDARARRRRRSRRSRPARSRRRPRAATASSRCFRALLFQRLEHLAALVRLLAARVLVFYREGRLRDAERARAARRRPRRRASVGSPKSRRRRIVSANPNADDVVLRLALVR